MTPDIERLAKEAGLMWGGDDGRKFLGSGRYDCEKELAKYTALIAEECAKEAECWINPKWPDDAKSIRVQNAATAIRAKFALPKEPV